MYDLSSYDTVATRITEFYKRYPNGVIITQILSDLVQVKDHVVMKASLWLDKEDYIKNFPPQGVGHSIELAGSKGASQDAWLENAETSAIGRALANRDIWLRKPGASADEMKKVTGMSPKNNNEPNIPNQDKPAMFPNEASSKQVWLIYKKLEEKGMDKNTAKQWLKDRLGSEMIPFKMVNPILKEIQEMKESDIPF